MTGEREGAISPSDQLSTNRASGLPGLKFIQGKQPFSINGLSCKDRMKVCGLNGRFSMLRIYSSSSSGPLQQQAQTRAKKAGYLCFVVFVSKLIAWLSDSDALLIGSAAQSERVHQSIFSVRLPSLKQLPRKCRRWNDDVRRSPHTPPALIERQVRVYARTRAQTHK
jgi:hypothetical protein